MIGWQIIVGSLRTGETKRVWQSGTNAGVSDPKWSYSREGGCADMSFRVVAEFDDALSGIDYFDDIRLVIDGVIWWRGFINNINRSLTEPEQIDVMASGYSRELENATFTWAFSRRTLRSIGGHGEIAGLVLFMLRIFPQLSGQRATPHPIFDTLYMEQSSYRPNSLVYRNDNIHRAITQLAVIAGNYDWGVDHNRRFYFQAPQPLPATTAIYSQSDANGAWWATAPDADEPRAYYGDESYRLPSVDAANMEASAVLVIGKDVLRIDGGRSIAGMKNAAVVYPAPAGGVIGEETDDPPTMVVKNSRSIRRFGRQRTIRITAPAAPTEDGRRYAEQRLELLGMEQVTARIVTRAITSPPLAVGCVLTIPDGQRYRIRDISCAFAPQGDEIETTLNCGTAPTDVERLGAELRELAIGAQDKTSVEPSPLILLDRLPPDADTWIQPSVVPV